MPYKVGDRVRIRNEEYSRVSDLISDARSSYNDQAITAKALNKIEDAVRNGKVWVVAALSNLDGYELKIEGTKIRGPWALDESDLTPA